MDSTDHDLDLRQVLDGLSYPADKWQIVACAEVYGFDSETRRALHNLPVRSYRSAADVAAALNPHETNDDEAPRAVRRGVQV